MPNKLFLTATTFLAAREKFPSENDVGRFLFRIFIAISSPSPQRRKKNSPAIAFFFHLVDSREKGGKLMVVSHLRSSSRGLFKKVWKEQKINGPDTKEGVETPEEEERRGKN